MTSNFSLWICSHFKDECRERCHPVPEIVPSTGELLSTRCPLWPLATTCSKMHHRELSNTRRDSGQIPLFLPLHKLLCFKICQHLDISLCGIGSALIHLITMNKTLQRNNR